MPIGKDIKVGTNEVKLFFKKKGLHLIKQENKTQKFQYREDNYTFLSYKEEMGILLYKNEYNNIKEISYYTDDLQTYNKLLKYLKNENWTFTYIGTDHDVEKIAINLSITNTLSFEKNSEGISEMFVKERNARNNYYKKISSNKDTKSNYFDEVDNDDGNLNR